MIERTNVSGMIPIEVFEEIFSAAQAESAFLQLGRRLRNMKGKEMDLIVQDALPMAYFVNGDTGLKQTTSANWKDKRITAEEIAVIVPIPDNVISDSRDNGHDLWEILRPQLSTALGKVVDAAIFLGIDKPASWPTAIVPGAVAAGNSVTQTSDGYADIMGEGGLISLVEEDGFMVNGFVGSIRARAYLRNIRTTTGIPLFNSMPDPIIRRTQYNIDGEPAYFPENGVMELEGAPLLIGGDFRQAVYSIREDIRFDIFNTGVISDNEGKILINLMQQDTSAVRMIFRMGWQLPNPINHINSDEDTRYPFGVLEKSDPEEVPEG